MTGPKYDMVAEGLRQVRRGVAMAEVVDVAHLIHARFEEGSLQADIAEDLDDDDPEPIQYQLKRALANLDEAD